MLTAYPLRNRTQLQEALVEICQGLIGYGDDQIGNCAFHILYGYRQGPLKSIYAHRRVFESAVNHDLAYMSNPSMSVTEEGGKNFMSWLQNSNKKDLYDKIVIEWTAFCNEAVPRECLICV